MRPTVTPASAPTTRARIAEVEAALGMPFPAAYVDFLLATNGGDAHPDAYPGGSVDTFFAVDAAKAHHDLLEIGETLADLLPPATLPIAHDYEGNVVCLSCPDGAVSLWSEERDVLAPLAPSLDAWLDSFTAAPLSDEDALRAALHAGDLAAATRLLDSGVIIAGAVAIAAGAGQRQAARLVLDRGAPILGALTAVAATGRTDLIDWLLAAGADVDEQMDDVVGTPLMVAAGNGALDMVRALLDRGADPRARTPAGQTAYDRAVHSEHFDVAALLQDRLRRPTT